VEPGSINSAFASSPPLPRWRTKQYPTKQNGVPGKRSGYAIGGLTNAIQCYTLLYVRKKLTAIRLKPEQLTRLGRIALRDDVPVSWLIRKAIDEFLKRQK
jgi:hypothetical protein